MAEARDIGTGVQSDMCRVTIALHPGVSLQQLDEATIVVQTGDDAVTLASLSGELVVALLSLPTGASLDQVEDDVLDAGDAAALARWYLTLTTLEGVAAVRYSVRDGGRDVVTFRPAMRAAQRTPRYLGGNVVLSRFAQLRRDGDVMILDSPLARGRVEILHPHVSALIGAMNTAATSAGIGARLPVIDPGWIEPVLTVLVAAGVVLPVDGDGATAEDTDDARRWEPADLALHSRSRTSRADLAVGGTYRHQGTMAAPQRRKDPVSATRIVLQQPDMDALRRSDENFTNVLERRLSHRRYSGPPLGVGQLSEFLFRSARTKAGSQFTRITRVYPSGGACYPLEIYVVVAECRGLEPGVYHYDAGEHALEYIDGTVNDASELFSTSSVPLEAGSPPQVMLVFTARFGRVNWKYEGNAYALVLAEVGALYQTMYLVATAMHLAPCAIGGGDAVAFAKIIGTDPLEESSVGGFMLGSLPAVTR